jgi:hypothetical protein
VGLRKVLDDWDAEVRIDLPGNDAIIYEEALSSTWHAAGVVVGLTGPVELVAARARRMASAYARLYRKTWPLQDVDERSDAEVRRLLEEAAEAARAEEARKAREAELARILPFGKLLYERRLVSTDWSAIAKEVGFPYRHSKQAAQAYAEHAGLPWPVRDTEVHDCGEDAYRRRVEKKEPWPVVAEALGRTTDHVRKAAHGYATRTGKPWPVVLKDFGPEVYRLRFVEQLTWEEVAARCHISRAWAIREANRHVATLPDPLPPPSTKGVDEQAYTMRAGGMGWKAIRARMKCSHSVAMERAKRHAEKIGKPWPIELPPVRTTHSPAAKAAYERGHVAREPWDVVAASLGYANVASAKTSARCYADRCNLPLDIRRRVGVTRNNARPRLAYERKAAHPEEAWSTIGAQLGYPSVQSAHTAARTWARKHSLPWPLPGDSDG